MHRTVVPVLLLEVVAAEEVPDLDPGVVHLPGGTQAKVQGLGFAWWACLINRSGSGRQRVCFGERLVRLK